MCEDAGGGDGRGGAGRGVGGSGGMKEEEEEWNRRRKNVDNRRLVLKYSNCYEKKKMLSLLGME